jgi:serine/threonine-protein kinase HipA
MRKAEVYLKGQKVGQLIEYHEGEKYQFSYVRGYEGAPISVTLPVRKQPYEFSNFPAFFDGLLPEGVNLEHLLRARKLDRNDQFGQLMAIGADTVGAVTVREVRE